jgi:hypothetical protein
MSIKIPSDLLQKERRLAVKLYQRELLRYILNSPRKAYILDNLVEMLGDKSKEAEKEGEIYRGGVGDRSGIDGSFI